MGGGGLLSKSGKRCQDEKEPEGASRLTMKPELEIGEKAQVVASPRY